MSATRSDLFAVKLNSHPVVKGLVAFGAAIGRLLPMRNGSPLFFFFPFYHVGGAEKVHAAIVRCFSDLRPWVLFTKKSGNDGFLPLFGAEARLCDASSWVKYTYPFSVGIMAGLINRHRHPVVFGCNNLFFYLLLPYLRPDVRRVDLIHAFGGGSEDFSLPVASELDARVVISRRTIDDLAQQYSKHDLPEGLIERVVLIENCVEVPETYCGKVRRERLKVLYVGRGTEEKRVHLVGQIARRCSDLGLPVEIILVGDVVAGLPDEDRSYTVLLGEIADQERLTQVYEDADLLLLTSSREGFPTVIMEGMARGVVPICTDVGGIPVHITTGENGWLVPNTLDEKLIVDEMVLIISRICKDRESLDGMSRTAYDYALVHFGGERFCAAYRSLLLGESR